MINFENGVTPINDVNLNKMQQDIGTVVSSTEPQGNNRLKIWLQNVDGKEKIYVLNNNNVYEEFMKKEADITDYKSKITQNNDYVDSFVPFIAEVRNNIAYVFFQITLKKIELQNTSYKLLSGLPGLNANYPQIPAILYEANGNKAIRLLINSNGELLWWYNSPTTPQTGNVLFFNTSYPIT